MDWFTFVTNLKQIQTRLKKFARVRRNGVLFVYPVFYPLPNEDAFIEYVPENFTLCAGLTPPPIPTP